jgi:hypothetical protein
MKFPRATLRQIPSLKSYMRQRLLLKFVNSQRNLNHELECRITKFVLITKYFLQKKYHNMLYRYIRPLVDESLLILLK